MKCQLCAAVFSSNVYSKPASWSQESREWLSTVHTHPLPSDAPVCRACEIFIKCNTGKENVVPRWVKKARQCNYCMVEGCGEPSHATTRMVTPEIARDYFDIKFP